MQEKFELHPDFVSFVTGEINPEKKQLVENWINSNPEYSGLLSGIAEATSFPDQDAGNEVEKDWHSLSERISTECITTGKRPLWVQLSAVAAVFVFFALLISAVFFYQGKISVHSGNKNQMSYILPDGSQVTLGDQTEIKYYAHFFNHRRTIHLTGEASFKVTALTGRPFKVYAGDLVVEVTGTHFLVNASPANSQVVVMVKEGKVEVSIAGKNGKTELLPNQQIIFSRSEKKFKVVETIELKSTNIGRRQFEFSHQKLTDVIKILEDYYGTDIEILIKNPDRVSLTAIIPFQPIDSVLEFLNRKLYFNLPGEGPFLIKNK